MSDEALSPNVYEEVLSEETVVDLASSQLDSVPTIDCKFLTILYLQNNKISSLPENFFPSLQNLMYLDLRDNCLTDIPKSIRDHPSLTHLLLQNNQLTSFPNELSTLNLKVLQFSGNPLIYPPKEILKEGLTKILAFLHEKFVDTLFEQSAAESEDNLSTNEIHETLSQGVVSFNSVIHDKLKDKTLSVKVNEKSPDDSSEYYDKQRGKCPKLAQSRFKAIPPYYQSSKYVIPSSADDITTHKYKIKQNYLKELAIKKHKELLAKRDKILQDRKNIELLKNWRKEYRIKQSTVDGKYKLEPKCLPYDVSPEYMTLLSREDIEKDLPDKYRRRLIRRSKPTVPRKSNNEVHLAIKIKQLFENLEAIDLNRKDMTPRTEQKVLLSEIQKISEIKQKLMELSSSNARSVAHDGV